MNKGDDDMPNVMTKAEAAYAADYQAYDVARAAYIAGEIPVAEYFKLRHAMEASLEAWEAERVAA